MIYDFIATRLPECRFTSASHACGRVFQVVLTALVYEKQYHLRMMMKMHGLGDRPYWSITYLYFLALFTIYMFCFILFGSIVGKSPLSSSSLAGPHCG